MKKFHGIIFDLDGTLLNTLEDIADSTNHALNCLGLPIHPKNAYRHMVGKGLENLILQSLPSDRKEPSFIKAGIKLMRDVYEKNWSVKTKPYSGIKELLDFCQKQSFKMAILSNKHETFTEKMVTYYFPSISFAKVFGAVSGIPLKPDPSRALEISRNFEIVPERIFFLGDSAIDMQTARNALMFPGGALWGFRREELLISAEKTFHSPEEVIRFLNET